MRIGIDFDNTIACYTNAIECVADDFFTLPDNLPRSKIELRNYLRTTNREREWTEFQGFLYGPGMIYAKPFDNAIATMHELEARGHELCIISHRSRYPYAGPRYNLHEAAFAWIEKNLYAKNVFTNNSSINFLETKEQKLAKIGELQCSLFLDDLVEIIESKHFPKCTSGILFDSQSKSESLKKNYSSISDWRELLNYISQE